MKNLFYAFIATLFIVSCKNEPKNYVELSGKVENLTDDIDSVTVFTREGFKRSFPIHEDGTFKDTLNVTEGRYNFKIGNEYGHIYLMNNDKLNLTTDYADFDKKLAFTGTGKSVNITKLETELLHLSLNHLNDETAKLPLDAFNKKMEEFKNEYETIKGKYDITDSLYLADTDKGMEANVKGFSEYHASKLALLKFKGQDSPKFNMEDINGKMVELDDFKGKYVYVDVWATWCGPCKREIPALKKLEEKYHDKDIVFVSMSVDALKDKEKWQKMVQEKELKGVQIFAENSWKSTFVEKYEIKGIPRFILIDKDGKILDADAPRPSSPKIEEFFNSLEI